MEKIKLGLALLILLTIFACSSNQTIDEKFNGMYKLDRFESFDSVTGKWVPDKWRGEYADGFILYDGKGHMSVHLYPKDYKDFDTNKNIDSLDCRGLIELTTFYKSNFVYFANYKVINDSTIEHHRVSATEPRNFGTTLIRNFEFRKDTLILTATEKIENKKMRLWWIKL
jgi:lipocalin-like protein